MGRLLGMSLLLPLFLISSVFGNDLIINNFQCGADSFPPAKLIAKLLLMSCPGSFTAHSNMCCIVHDHCYDNHARTKYSQEYCDEHFCRCLQDASDQTKHYGCGGYMKDMCAVVKTFRTIHGNAKYVDHSPEFVDWVDLKPLKFEFKPLFDACISNKRLVVHCHNMVYWCSQKDHEKDKREVRLMTEEEYEEWVKHSYEDCRATAYECLYLVDVTADNNQCLEIAQKMQKEANPYEQLDVAIVGKSIVSAYPIIASRLVSKCPNSAAKLRQCYKDFDTCYTKNPIELPSDDDDGNDNGANGAFYLYDSPVRRINITCHWGLTACIQQATDKEDAEVCLEARDLAVDRIRETDLKQYGDLYSYPREVFNWLMGGIASGAKSFWRWIKFW